MIKKATIIILLCWAFPTLFFGQGETSNWYFGKGAGIIFNNDGTVKVADDGQLDTVEGCATISNSSGNLLFYTDGIVVYNQDHEIMDNGTDLFGDPSSTQSAIIVPQPGNSNMFYIFTVDTALSQTNADKGLNYSIVDLSLNGGKGAVVNKNIPLLTHSSEKLAAVVKNCTDQSIWLITLASEDGETSGFNTYHAFEISTTGVANTSIKSTFENLYINDPRGYLKISSDGTQVASANMVGGLFVYDFDLETGIFSNQQRLSITGPNEAAYGVEFSPNGRFLYIHASKDSQEEIGHSSTLLQFDLQAGDISSSQVVLDDQAIFRGALQLGANGKIYRTIAKSFTEGTPFLGVINKPNELGINAGYKHNSISLGTKNAMQGLPPFVQSFLNKTDLLTDSTGKKVSSITLCNGEDIRLEAEDIPGATYSWKKDGVPFSNSNNNTFDIFAASSTDAGRYQLEIILNDPLECPIVGEALIEVSALPETSNLILTQCDIELNDSSDGYASFDLNQLSGNEGFSMFFYESLSDRTNNIGIANTNSYTNTTAFNQTIFYSSINDSGCEGYGEVVLQVSPTTLNESILSPIMICDENSNDAVLESSFDLEKIAQDGYGNLEVAFYSNLDDMVLEKNQLPDLYISGDTTIYVRLENDNQCLGVEKINLVVNPLPELELADSYQVCTDGESLPLEAPLGFDSYAWYKLDQGQLQKISDKVKLAISEGGTYTLEVGTLYVKDGQMITCATSKDFVVNPSNKAVFQEIKIEDASNNNTIEVLVSGDGDYEYSINGIEYQDANNFENVDAGFYMVFVRDKRGCGVSDEEIAIMGFPKFFTPNGDGFNDQWQLIGIDQNGATAIISIFNRLGKLMVQLNSDEPGWDGTFQGKRLPASDYWFNVAFEDGKKFKGHFSLMR